MEGRRCSMRAHLLQTTQRSISNKHRHFGTGIESACLGKASLHESSGAVLWDCSQIAITLLDCHAAKVSLPNDRSKLCLLLHMTQTSLLSSP